MLFRQFIPEDLDRVLEIEEMSFSKSYGKSVFQQLYNMGVGFLVAVNGDLVVGYIIFWIKDEGIGHIISLAVDKSYRNLKIGSVLLSKAIEVFEKTSVYKITLEVNEHNEVAINFYKKFNFEIDRLVPNYYEKGEGAFVMNYYIKA